MQYTVNQLATMTGLTPRTLRHYDAIGLLPPSNRNAAGYRLYADKDLLRLQQILLYREVEMPLADIARILDAPDFDARKELEAHKERLARRAERLLTLMDTIDRTIGALGAVKDDAAQNDWAAEYACAAQYDWAAQYPWAWLYEGFHRETVVRWEGEAQERWGDSPAYAQSRRRLKALGREGFKELRARGDRVEAEFTELYRSGGSATGREARALAERWAAYLNEYYEAGPEVVAGLGRLYAEHPEFRARYEGMASGLADWLSDALSAWAARERRG